MILFAVMMGLVGYIVLAIGFIAIFLQKTFQSYNLKLEHLKELILDISNKKNNEIKENKETKENK
jgi:uncharacterized membrane protein